MSRNWNTDELAVDREDALKIAKEFQYIWTRNVLLKTGMDIEDCFPEEDDPDEMTLEQKINLRSALKINDILVLSSPEGGINIYFEKEIIGIWKKPYHILHEDLAQLDPKKSFILVFRLNIGQLLMLMMLAMKRMRMKKRMRKSMRNMKRMKNFTNSDI